MSYQQFKKLAATGVAGVAALLGATHVSASIDTMLGSGRTATDVIQIASDAHSRLMSGDLAGYRELIGITANFTFMGPFGGEPRRAADFPDSRWAEIVRFFRNGRDADLEVVQVYQSGNMVVIVAIERATVEVGAMPAQNWSLRVTLVFIRRGDKWLLTHRHADPLVQAVSLEKAAGLAKVEIAGS